MRRRRDDIATELTQTPGVIEALAVSESEQRHRGAEMNQPDQQFRIVMRGYDPADVDRVVAGLRQRAEEAEPGVRVRGRG